MENEVMYIKLDDIIPNRFQPREVFDEKALNELADSIRQHGVIEPIIVRPISNKFEIIAGERRYKASAIAGLTKIPAIVKNMDDKESSLVAFIENEQRRDVSVIESARTSERILKSSNMTQEELAKSIGISQSTLANRLRLLELPLEIQEALMHNEISERHARSLLGVKDESKQIELLRKIKGQRMTVRDLENEIKNINSTSEFNNTTDTIPSSDEGNGGFMNFLNNQENNFLSNTISQNNELNSENTGSNNFMSYLNNYDNNSMNNNINPNPSILDVPTSFNSITDDNNSDSFMNYLNNYDNNVPVNNDTNQLDNNSVNELENNSTNGIEENSNFMNYLNNYDNNNPLPTEASSSDNVSNSDNNDSFMSYLNNYDSSNPLPTNEVADNQDLDYLNNNSLKETPFTDSLNNFEHIDTIDDNMEDINTNNSNLLINNVNPPITSNFNNNAYVEDNPNYVDVSKNVVIDNVDDIIGELKKTIDKIKSESKFKIDTDEINFDDIYQVTIKIDKRDF